MRSVVLARTLIKTSCLRSSSGLRLLGLTSTVKVQPQSNLSTNADIEENIKNFNKIKFDKLLDPENGTHFRQQPSTPAQVVNNENALSSVQYPIGEIVLPHPIWSTEELTSVTVTHKPPSCFVDKAAFSTVQTLRLFFDIMSGFKWGERNEKKWLTRIVFLETVAAVPGMVAAMTRHFNSLRHLKRDFGWIHTLLEEAENERMHLMTALQLKQPSWLFRLGVLCTQGLFVPTLTITYLISPKFCHRFVGYLEEEAVKTYTKCLQDVESGPIQHWKTQLSPDVATRYWKLPNYATMKDVILNIRADEAHHRLVNHTLASMKPTDYNPYKPGH